jgi:hypothetical protein
MLAHVKRLPAPRAALRGLLLRRQPYGESDTWMGFQGSEKILKIVVNGFFEEGDPAVFRPRRRMR